MPAARDARRDPPTEIDLPPLTVLGGDDLRPGGDYEAVDLADLDLAGRDASGSRFQGCRIVRCELDGLALARARFVECVLDDVRAIDLDLADGGWRDVLVTGSRFGAVRASGATWDGVRVRGSRANLVDLRGGRIADVVIEDCTLDELDLGGSDARRVRLDGSRIGRLTLDGARLTDVDLTRATIETVDGIGGLRGAIVGPAQLLDLGPQLAAFLGIRVR